MCDSTSCKSWMRELLKKDAGDELLRILEKAIDGFPLDVSEEPCWSMSEE